MVTSRAVAEHYTWGAGCDGWRLAPGPDLSVIEERMPPGTAETRHAHARARQFFYVLSGVLTMARDTGSVCVRAMEGIEIPPGVPHQARNDSDADVRFLVISSPATHGDRQDVPASQ